MMNETREFESLPAGLRKPERRSISDFRSVAPSRERLSLPFESKNCARVSNQGLRRPRGVASVELAFVLILLMLLTVGSLEVCNLIYLKQSLAQTAYDGGMLALRPGIRETDVRQHVEQLLSARRITASDITITGALDAFDNIERGDSFWVKIRANPVGNVSVVPWALPGDEIEAVVVGRKQ